MIYLILGFWMEIIRIGIWSTISILSISSPCSVYCMTSKIALIPKTPCTQSDHLTGSRMEVKKNTNFLSIYPSTTWPCLVCLLHYAGDLTGMKTVGFDTGYRYVMRDHMKRMEQIINPRQYLLSNPSHVCLHGVLRCVVNDTGILRPCQDRWRSIKSSGMCD